jgi:hypothetical protein
MPVVILRPAAVMKYSESNRKINPLNSACSAGSCFRYTPAGIWGSRKRTGGGATGGANPRSGTRPEATCVSGRTTGTNESSCTRKVRKSRTYSPGSVPERCLASNRRRGERLRRRVQSAAGVFRSQASSESTTLACVTAVIPARRNGGGEKPGRGGSGIGARPPDTARAPSAPQKEHPGRLRSGPRCGQEKPASTATR